MPISYSVLNEKDLDNSFLLYIIFYLIGLRLALNNHVIIVLLFIDLIYEITSVPLMLYWYQFGDSWKLTLTREHTEVFKPFRLHLLPISRPQCDMKNLKRIRALRLSSKVIAILVEF
jgi:hypothetical protein